MARITVIGEHWSTLSAAARLAAAGHDVSIVASVPVSNSPLNITLPAALRDLFLKTGSALEETIELIDLEFMFQSTINGKEFAMPGVGVGAAVTAVSTTFGVESGTEWKSVMAKAQVRWDSIRLTVEEPAANKSASWWKRTPSLKHRLRAVSPSVAQVMRLSVTSQLDESEVLMADHIVVPYVASTFGMYSVVGGRQALHHALAHRCSQLGVATINHHSESDFVVIDSRYSPVQIPHAIDINMYRRIGPSVAMSVLAGSAVSKAITQRLRLDGG